MRKWFKDWQELNPILADGEVGEIIDMVDTKTGDGKTPWRDLPYTRPARSDGIPGVPMVRAFPFAFDTPGLLTGASVYTPTPGDILLDAWIEVTEAWDGTTPKGDVGNDFAAQGEGWFTNLSFNQDTINMAQVDHDAAVMDLLTQNTYSHTGSASGLYQAILGGNQPRFLPAKFISANPVKVVVSQDGFSNGADPGSTQGAATLYLVTVTPV